jgi:hypothetical protein
MKMPVMIEYPMRVVNQSHPDADTNSLHKSHLRTRLRTKMIKRMQMMQGCQKSDLNASGIRFECRTKDARPDKNNVDDLYLN